MEPGGLMQHSQVPPIIPILNRMNLIPRIDAYFIIVHFNITHLRQGLPKTLFPVSLPVKILKTVYLFPLTT
jgi:hypothetical protein